MNRQQRADSMLILATFLWGASNCLMSICLQDLQPLTLNAFRFLSAFLLLSVLFLPHLRRVNQLTIRYALMIGGCLIMVYLGATYGILYTSVSNAGFIGALTVLFTPIFEFIVYRKRPDKRLGFCLTLCFIGMSFLTLGDSMRPALGDLLCLSVPTFYAIDLMITQKAVTSTSVDPIGLGVWQLGVVGVVMLLLSAALETPHFPRTPVVWVSALFLGFFCSGLCFVIQDVEQQFTSPSRASLIFTLEPLFSAICAYFLLGERLSGRGYLGAGLMLSSLFLMEMPLFREDLS